MSNTIKGLALVAALTAAGLVWAGAREAAEPDAEEPEKGVAIRTAEREVTVGSYTCFGSGTGEVTVTVNYEGTTGVFAQPEGFSVRLTTLVAAVDADPTCAALTEDFTTVLAAYPCTVSQTRLIAATRDLIFVCSGNRSQVLDSVGASAAFVAANVRTAP